MRMPNKWLVAVLLLGMLFAPISVVSYTSHVTMALAQPVDEGGSEVAPTVDSSPVGEAALPALAPPVEEEKPVKLPWYFKFFWPAISTALIAALRTLSPALKARMPALFWPVINAGLAAVIAGVAATIDPANLVNNIVTAVVAAFGMVKMWDAKKGKNNTITKEDKALLAEAKLKGVKE